MRQEQCPKSSYLREQLFSLKIFQCLVTTGFIGLLYKACWVNLVRTSVGAIISFRPMEGRKMVAK